MIPSTLTRSEPRTEGLVLGHERLHERRVEVDAHLCDAESFEPEDSAVRVVERRTTLSVCLAQLRLRRIGSGVWRRSLHGPVDVVSGWVERRVGVSPLERGEEVLPVRALQRHRVTPRLEHAPSDVRAECAVRLCWNAHPPRSGLRTPTRMRPTRRSRRTAGRSDSPGGTSLAAQSVCKV